MSSLQEIFTNWFPPKDDAAILRRYLGLVDTFGPLSWFINEKRLPADKDKIKQIIIGELKNCDSLPQKRRDQLRNSYVKLGSFLAGIGRNDKGVEEAVVRVSEAGNALRDLGHMNKQISLSEQRDDAEEALKKELQEYGL